MNNESILNAYKRYAPVYDWVFGKIFHPGRQAALDAMNWQDGDRVLEVGVGTGLSLPDYPPGVTVTGIDLSQAMLDKAHKRVQEEQLENVTLHRMDAQTLDFPDQSFDKIIVLYVLSVVPDPYQVLAEIRRVCKPGAEVIFVNHFSKQNPLMRRIEAGLARYASGLGFQPDFPLQPVLDNVGLEVQEVRAVNLLGYWTMVHGRHVETP
ncbi:MAG: class I SAM-dependent methyltransferase [Oleiphilaceae bacterium]|nr:class I SAM-dependent methyltransferase [Oleiphilaceae bacterium]